MKTIIQILGRVLEEARKLAHRQHTTLKTLVKEGLRRIVSEHKSVATLT